MAEDELPEIVAEAVPAFRPRRSVLALVAVLAVLALGLTALWLQRENLAHRIIGRQLSHYDLPATYRLEKVGPLEQVLTQVLEHQDLSKMSNVLLVRYVQINLTDVI